MTNFFDLKGKVAVVTGGRRGLGKAMSKALVECGAHVIIVAKSSEYENLANEMDNYSGKITYLQIDLTKRSAYKNLIDTIVQEFGSIDILINNAGEQCICSLEDYTSHQWDLDMQLLVTTVFELSQQAARYMKQQGRGKIIQIASISSFQGARNIIGYSTAKHALIGMVKSLANELAPYNINVNALAPGIFRTDMAASVFEDVEKAEIIRSRIPSGRFGEPDDIVGPMLFLASDMSRHIHGHTIVVDGGWLGR